MKIRPRGNTAVYLAYAAALVVGLLLLYSQFQRNRLLRIDLVEEQASADVQFMTQATSTIMHRLDAVGSEIESDMSWRTAVTPMGTAVIAALQPAPIRGVAGYALDSLPASMQGRLQVNLTGIGPNRGLDSDAAREISAVLARQESMSAIVEDHRAVSLVFYTSARSFQVATPRVPSIEGAINPAYAEREYYYRALSDVNPEGAMFWTAPYRDSRSGKNTITVSRPIRESDRLIGVLSADVTLKSVAAGLGQRRTSFGTSFLVLPDRTVLARSNDTSSVLDELTQIGAVLPDALEPLMERELQAPRQTFHRLGGHDVLCLPVEGSNWTYVVVMDAADLTLETLGVMAPEFAVVIVLLVLMVGIEFFRRSRSEVSATKGIAEELARKLSRYVAPQIVESVFTGQKDVVAHTDRKKLTVFFSDIKDFTSTTEGLEPEDLAALLNDYLNEMTQIALDHGATIDKYIGDAIVAFFGDPQTLGVDEDALQCVRMAVAMQRRMHGFRSKWNELGIGRPFHMRIGINTGYCNVGNFGSDERLDYTIIGSEVNKASRLESACEPDGILLSEETYALVRGMVELQGAVQVQMKGFEHPVTAYQITGLIAADDDRYVADHRPGVRLFIDAKEISDHDRQSVVAKLRRAIDRLSD